MGTLPFTCVPLMTTSMCSLHWWSMWVSHDLGMTARNTAGYGTCSNPYDYVASSIEQTCNHRDIPSNSCLFSSPITNLDTWYNILFIDLPGMNHYCTCMYKYMCIIPTFEVPVTSHQSHSPFFLLLLLLLLLPPSSLLLFFLLLCRRRFKLTAGTTMNKPPSIWPSTRDTCDVLSVLWVLELN